MAQTNCYALVTGLLLGWTLMNTTGCTHLRETSNRDQVFRDGRTWCGDPDAVQDKMNPYVQLAERNVTRALQHPDLFWYVWGYAAPESSRRGDAKLRALAVTEMNALADKFAATPGAYWDILVALESVRLLQRMDGFPPELIAPWLQKLRASVDANVAINNANTEWMCVAPNTLHQSAAILQLASLLYGEKKYSDLAHALIRKAGAYQEPDGAFRYIRNSGPSQIYYGFDSTFLGRYYQLSRDPVARTQLIRMAGYSRDALANGLMESSSSPWWKHHWGTGGPLHGVEIIAGLSRDPLSRAVAEHRLGYAQPFFFGYYGMYFWDPTIPTVPLAPDLCRYNTNIAGPQLRNGAWQVVMPGKAYADTGIGCTVVKGPQQTYDGYLEAAALPVMDKSVADAYHRPGSLISVAPDELATRATVVGDGWIAAAWTFQPRQPFFADATPPPPRGWRLTQLWFADGESFGGWLSVACEKDTSVITGPRGYLGFGHAPVADLQAPLTLTAGAVSTRVWGVPDDAVAAIGKEPKCWVNLPGTGERAYRAGERFGYGLSGSAAGLRSPQVTVLPAEGGLVVVQLTWPDTRTVLLAFNPSAAAVQGKLPSGSDVPLWRSGKTPGAKPTVAKARPMYTLQPCELIVVRR